MNKIELINNLINKHKINDIFPSNSWLNQITHLEGIPKHKIIDICGDEQSGKTIISYQIMKELQNDYKILYIDTDFKSNIDFMRKIGLNEKDIIYVASSDLDEILNIIDIMGSTDIIQLVIIDSIAGLKNNKDTNTSKLLNLAIKQFANKVNKYNISMICISQYRFTLSGENIKLGKKAFDLYSSLSLICNKDNDIIHNNKKIGEQIKIITEKNKISNYFQEYYYKFYY